MNWRRYGPNAWLLRFADSVGDDAFYRGRSILGELKRHPPAGLVEYVFGFTTVLLEFDSSQPQIEEAVLPEFWRRLALGSLAKMSTEPVKEIPVTYGGPDLERVANANHLSPAEVIERNLAPIYKVYFLGFAPGFPYLGDLDERLHTPRWPSPRTAVPAGAVAIGGQHTGIYTVASPGGWNIIGHTPLRIFDPARSASADEEERMFFLQAGDRVRFVRHGN